MVFRSKQERGSQEGSRRKANRQRKSQPSPSEFGVIHNDIYIGIFN